MFKAFALSLLCITTTLFIAERFLLKLCAYMDLNCLCDFSYTPACRLAYPVTCVTASQRWSNACRFSKTILDACYLPKTALVSLSKKWTSVQRCCMDSAHNSKDMWRLNKKFTMFTNAVRDTVVSPVSIRPHRLSTRPPRNEDKLWTESTT